MGFKNNYILYIGFLYLFTACLVSKNNKIKSTHKLYEIVKYVKIMEPDLGREKIIFIDNFDMDKGFYYKLYKTLGEKFTKLNMKSIIMVYTMNFSDLDVKNKKTTIYLIDGVIVVGNGLDKFNWMNDFKHKKEKKSKIFKIQNKINMIKTPDKLFKTSFEIINTSKILCKFILNKDEKIIYAPEIELTTPNMDKLLKWND